jgi:hypothetical protein
MSSPSKISQLSALIAEHTAAINNFFVENKLPNPSFEANALWSLPIPDDAEEIKAARLAVIEACAELQALVTGPKEFLRVNVKQVPHHSNTEYSPGPVYCLRQHPYYLALQSGQIVRCGRINYFRCYVAVLGTQRDECQTRRTTCNSQSSFLP